MTHRYTSRQKNYVSLVSLSFLELGCFLHIFIGLSSERPLGEGGAHGVAKADGRSWGRGCILWKIDKPPQLQQHFAFRQEMLEPVVQLQWRSACNLSATRL